MVKTYIAGKIAGDPNYREKFAKVAERLQAIGNVPLNPAMLPSGMAPADYMRICFAMIDSCDFVYLLPDCADSPGARLEIAYCEYIGKLMTEGAL